jgi:hypothetical protein
MDTTADLDALKRAWQTLDRRLAEQHAVQVELLADRKRDRLRSGLRPLAIGQAIQIVAGVVVAVLGAGFWVAHRAVPHLLVAGLVVHAYGIALIVMGAVVRAGIAGLDYAAPVVELQRQLARTRRTYVASGLILGLSWWFLWVPFAMVLLAGAGADLYRDAPLVVWLDLAVGVAGFAGTWALYRWARRTGRRRLARLMDNAITGRSLRAAQAVVDAIAAFAADEPATAAAPPSSR